MATIEKFAQVLSLTKFLLKIIKGFMKIEIKEIATEENSFLCSCKNYIFSCGIIYRVKLCEWFIYVKVYHRPEK